MTLGVRVGVAIWVQSEDQYLLGERIGSHGAHTFAFPGGHVEFSETPEQTVQRELLEETALIAKSIKPIAWTNDYFKQEGKHYITLHYLVDEFIGEPQLLEPNKCRGWNWYRLEEIQKMPNLFLSVKEALLSHSFLSQLNQLNQQAV